MKTLDSQIRQRRFCLDECQRRTAQLESMIAELRRRSSELEHDIELEHSRTRISDPRHFAYSPLAKSITQSRANLERSIQTFEFKLEAEKRVASEAVETLNELLQERQHREEHTNRSAESSTGQNAMHGSMVPAVII